MMIAPDTMHGEQERDLGEGVHVDGRERIPLMAVHLLDIANRGEGLTGRGMEHPPPLSPVSAVEWYSSTTPAARRVPRLLPPPPEGGGQ